MKKTIHIYSQYYYPISNAAANRIEKYVMALKDNYEIKIITGMPNYPNGVKEKKYKWKLFLKENGLYNEEIIRAYEFASENKGFLKRTLNYLSFMLSSLIYGIFSKKPDLIIVTSPPLFTAIGVLILHKIRKIPYILEIRDLWPDSVVALGYMKKESISYKLFSWFENKLYKNAKKIIGVTKGICKEIENKGIKKDKIILQYNVFNENNKIDDKKEELKDIIEKFNIDINNKVFVYAGNHSPAQNLFNILKLAKNYKKGNFYFLGDGESKKDLEQFVLNNKLNNIFFLGQQKKDIVYKFIKLSDFCLASLDNNPLFKDAIPTKILEYLYFNKPVICFIKGDLAEKIKKYKAGIVFEKYDNKILQEIENFKYIEGSGKNIINNYFSFKSFQENINNLLSLEFKKLGKK